MPANLLELPTELIEHIAALADVDMRNLRLTCLSLKEACLHPFKERFFLTREITMTVESLKVLVTISKHPLFGSFIQNLVIDATPRFENEYTECNRKLDNSRNDRSLHRFLTLELELGIKKRRQALAQSIQRQEDRKLLTQAFSNLRRLKAIIFCYDGLKVAESINDYNLDKIKHLIRCQDEMARPFISAVTAICSSGAAIQEITIQKERRHGFIGIARLEGLSDIFYQLRPGLSCLRILHLDLRDFHPSRRLFARFPEKGSFVGRFLSQLVNLRELNLSLFCDLANVGDFELPNLVSLTFGTSISSSSNLVRLLETSRNSLKHLTLRHALLVDSTWSSFLTQLSNSFDLEYVFLDTVKQSDGRSEHLLLTYEGNTSVVLKAPDLKEKLKNCSRTYSLDVDLQKQRYHDDLFMLPRGNEIE